MPGIGKKSAWRLVSDRAKRRGKNEDVDLEAWFQRADLPLSETLLNIFG